MKISIISLKKAILQHCMNSPFASELLTRGRILVITTNEYKNRIAAVLNVVLVLSVEIVKNSYRILTFIFTGKT